MKPKPYRKTKPTKGSDLANFHPTEAGGGVEGVIVGPESSMGTVVDHPSADQGNDKGLTIPQGPTVESSM